MKNKAFTLIELLVVVLIIGILAAIAVLQYRKAVQISQVKSVLPIIRSIYDAQQRYYLANSKYTKDIEDLDIKPEYIEIRVDTDTLTSYKTSWGYFTINNNSPVIYATIEAPNVNIDYYGPTEKNICYYNNDICSKFGQTIIVPASDHWSGTNVYYVDNW